MSALPDNSAVLRTMRVEDLDAVCAIERRIYAFPWTHRNFADSIESGYLCTVMEQAGAVIGYGVLAVAAGESHLLNLSIAAQWQRRGLGRVLLLRLIDMAREHSARIMLLEVRPSNAAARALYASAGFEHISMRRGYYPDVHGREDALVLAFKL